MEMCNAANCKIPIEKANGRVPGLGDLHHPACRDSIRVETIPESSKSTLLALEAGLTGFDLDQFLTAWNLLEKSLILVRPVRLQCRQRTCREWTGCQRLRCDKLCRCCRRMSWMFASWALTRKASVIGAAAGAVAGV